MTIPIDPILFSLGPLAVRWFGVLALLGLLVGVWRTLRAVERQGLSRAQALDALAWAVRAGVIVGRAVYLLGWWDYSFTHASEVWQLVGLDGLSLWGALIGGGAIALARLGRWGSGSLGRGDVPLQRR